MVPLLHRYYEALRLPAILPNVLIVLGASVPFKVLYSLLSSTEPALEGQGFYSDTPNALFDGNRWISQVPGESVSTCPALRPRGRSLPLA